MSVSTKNTLFQEHQRKKIQPLTQLLDFLLGFVLWAVSCRLWADFCRLWAFREPYGRILVDYRRFFVDYERFNRNVQYM